MGNLTSAELYAALDRLRSDVRQDVRDQVAPVTAHLERLNSKTDRNITSIGEHAGLIRGLKEDVEQHNRDILALASRPAGRRADDSAADEIAPAAGFNITFGASKKAKALSGTVIASVVLAALQGAWQFLGPVIQAALHAAGAVKP